MATSGHQDVDLPRSTWHRAGAFLTDFAQYLSDLGFQTWTVDKEAGNHLCSHWLYIRMVAGSPARSQIQFGVTSFAKVNPWVHAYARGKGEHLSAAVRLLQIFVDQVWAEQATAPAEITMTPAQHEHWNQWDQWEVLEMGQFRCPTTERVWYSDDSGSTWFMPDSSGLRSVCGSWLCFQDEEAGIWWCNETDRQLLFLAAA